MTIPGVDMAVAVAIVATVGDFSRFESPAKLVSYVGLDPSVSANPVGSRHPRADLQAGRAWARGHAGRGGPCGQPHTPGPLHAFHERVKARRGMADRHRRGGTQTAGDLLAHDPRRTRLRVHARPSLVAKKTRALELRAGVTADRGRPAGPPRPTTSEPSGTDA